MTGGLLAAGLGTIAIGTLLAAARAGYAAGILAQATGAACVAAAGFWLLADGDSLGSAFTSEFAFRLGVDPLSGFFLGTLGLIALPALVFSLRYLEPDARGRTVAVLTGLFLLALAALFCAREGAPRSSGFPPRCKRVS